MEGRLQNTAGKEQHTQHSYVSPSNHRFTHLLNEKKHKWLFHVGPNTLLSFYIYDTGQLMDKRVSDRSYVNV